MKFKVNPTQICTIWFIPIIIVLSTIYLKVYNFEFTYDDQLTIVQNELVNKGELSTNNIIKIFQSPYKPGTLYRPITILSYLLNSAATGLHPGYFHLVNLGLHIILGVLLYYLLNQIKISNLLALSAVLLWFVHPVHSEVIGGVVGRAEILAALFGALALLPVIKGDTTKPHLKYLGSALLLLLSVLSKESGIAIAPLIVIVAINQTRSFKKAGYLSFYLIAAILVAIGLRYSALGADILVRYPPEIRVAANPLINVPFDERIVPSLQLLGRYLLVTILPIKLSADYSLAPDRFYEVFNSPYFLALALIPTLLFPLIYRRSRQGISWLLSGILLLLPILNLFTPIGTIFAERLLYLPSLLLLISILVTLKESIGRLQFTAAVLILFALFTYSTCNRLGVWRNNDVLFAQTINDAPLSPKAHLNYALNLYQRGDLKLARKHAEIAEDLFAGNIDVSKLLLKISLDTEDITQAKHWLKISILRDPRDQHLRVLSEKLATFPAITP